MRGGVKENLWPKEEEEEVSDLCCVVPSELVLSEFSIDLSGIPEDWGGADEKEQLVVEDAVVLQAATIY